MDLKLSLVKAISIYLEDCTAREQSPDTVVGKRSMLNHFAQFCLENNKSTLDEVDDSLMEEYRRYLVNFLSPQKLPLDVTTRRNKLTAVKVFLRRMYELHHLVSDPSARFLLPKRPRRLPDGILADEELEAIFKQTELHGDTGRRDKVILETYYASAIRRAELARLTLFDLDTHRLRLRVNKGKGQKDRIIPIAKRACESIKYYVSALRPKYMNFNSGDALFLNNQGLAFTPRQLSNLVRKYVMRSGVNRKGACNLYRHTAATAMLENGADIRIIQQQLGHADISTTQIYTHVSNRKLEQVYHQTHPAALSR